MNIVITGAANGLGAQLVNELSVRGHNLCLLDVAYDDAPVQEGNVWRRRLDVSQAAEWAALVAWLKEMHWQPDVLVNNAGIGAYGSIHDLEPTDWEKQLAVNLTGPFLGIKYLQPGLSEKGMILNIGSRRGLWAVAGRAAYSAAKFGLRGLSLAAAVEFAAAEELPDQTKVSIVELDSMLTNFANGLANKEARQKNGELFLKTTDVAKEISDLLEGKRLWLTEWRMRATADGYTISAVEDGCW